MLLYYRVERDRCQKYIISLYYRNLLGSMKEMHRSVHNRPVDVNEVIQHYRQAGYHVQSVATA